MRKIGRNDPCPCGSGKKYKRCCRLKEPSDKVKRKLSEAILDGQKKIKIHQINQMRRKQRFGEVRDIIHVDFKGYKMVAVGNELHYSKKWKTFPDFLMNYAPKILGETWGNTELNKSEIDQHEIIKWYVGARNHMRTGWDTEYENGVRSGILDGYTAAFLRMSYDLYVLRHHSAFQQKVVERLKHKDQFQGARYELFVAATFIRAGFNIDYEDEEDKTSKHPEFLARHKETGECISVEAKSRHRPGVLGFSGEKETDGQIKLGIKRLMNKAFRKEPENPFAVFIDLNIPPFSGRTENKPWFQELWNSVYEDGGPSKNHPDPFNLLVFSNHPEHYGEPGKKVPPNESIYVISQMPEKQMRQPELLMEIVQAVNKYGNIPNHFPEKWDSGEIEPL